MKNGCETDKPAAYIGVDIGTTGARALLISRGRGLLASAGAEYALSSPAPGRAEENPEDWYTAVCECLRRVAAAAAAAGYAVTGIGLTGQMHGLCLLDGGGNVLRPAILWCDTRTDEECRALEANLGRERLVALSGNAALPAFTASKFMWVRAHEPEIASACRHILLPKDYVRFRLCGGYLTEPSDASGSQLFDTRRRVWSEELCAAAGVAPDMLPRVVPSDVYCSAISPEAAAACGIPAGTPVCGGASDNAATAVGLGALRDGDAFATVGSSGVIYCHSDTFAVDPAGRVNTFCAALGGWALMSTAQSAGLSLRWFARNIWGGADCGDYGAICDAAAAVPAGARGVGFLPYLMGDRTPHMNASARGAFTGLSGSSGRAEMARAVLEGVAYSMRDGLDIIDTLRKSTGQTAGQTAGGIPSLMLCGGGSRSPVWRRIMTDIFDRPATCAGGNVPPDTAAYGAALLAAYADGVLPERGFAGACERLEPGENAAVYRRLRPEWQALYPALHRRGGDV